MILRGPVFLAALASVALALAAAPGARASALTGDTVVDVTFDLSAAGLSPSLLGDAETTSDGFLLFPITGGDLTAGLIEHDGSGLRLSAGAAFIDLENFLIDIADPAQSLLFGDITDSSAGLTAEEAPLFSFDLTGVDDPFDLANPAIPLTVTSQASTALNAVFGLGGDDALTGASFGLAATAPVSVPGPMTALLLTGGLGLLAARRKTARAA